MFRRIDETADSPEVDIWLDDVPHRVPASLSVAAAVLMLKGWQGYRCHQDGSSRAPLCMMGVCHECLIRVDGQPNRQGCLIEVASGMHIQRQTEARDDSA